MSALSKHRSRPQWRACLAVVAVLANLALPAAWALATPVTDGFGDTYSICLANGSQAVVPPGSNGPETPAASALHCGLCLVGGTFEAVAGSAGTMEAPRYSHTARAYGYIEPALMRQFHALIFDPRAPPA